MPADTNCVPVSLNAAVSTCSRWPRSPPKAATQTSVRVFHRRTVLSGEEEVRPEGRRNDTSQSVGNGNSKLIAVPPSPRPAPPSLAEIKRLKSTG